MSDVITYVLTGIGLVFFFAGSLGVVRFSDIHSRLHALTKADTLGLGFVLAGLAFQAPDWMSVGKIALIWVLALVAAGTTAQLIARSAFNDPEPRRRDR